ncbi:MAG: radical SAM protein [Planctomycetota bacterium]|nr:radical SAM protein [Planctomycetota bacterium]
MAHGAPLDLVLINPSGRRRIYQSLGAELAAIETPVWAGLMAAFVRRRGFSIAMVDANAEELGPEETAARVEELKPLLAAIVVYGHQPSASTQVMPAASLVCNAIKDRVPAQKVILVGGHVAALPELTLQQERADFVAGGEGLYTLVDLLAALTARSDDWSKVRSLWYRDAGRPRRTMAAPLLKDLDDEMPGIAWDLFNVNRYRAHNWHCFGGLERQPYAALYTTLGCPYTCTFCCIQAPFKEGEKQSGHRGSANSYRYWSTETVIRQLDLLAEQGVRNIKIADEMFVLNPRHVLGICNGIIEHRHRFNIWAYARVDTVKDTMLEKLKQAGVSWLAFGIEAASEHVRADVRKGYGQEDAAKTIERVRAAGINVIANYIFGLPEDDLRTMQATLDLALDLNCEFANLYCTMAYPGSALYDQAARSGWKLPDSWSGYSQHAVDMLPLPTRHLSAAEVIRFRDQAFHTYFSHPRYLEMVARKFGEETVRHIRAMASHKLERRESA